MLNNSWMNCKAYLNNENNASVWNQVPIYSKQHSSNLKFDPGRTTGSTVIFNTLQKTYQFLVKYFSPQKQMQSGIWKQKYHGLAVKMPISRLWTSSHKNEFTHPSNFNSSLYSHCTESCTRQFFYSEVEMKYQG